MSDNPAVNKLTSRPFYIKSKDAMQIITNTIGTGWKNHALAVYDVLNCLANDKGDQLKPFTVPVGLIAYRSGLSRRMISDIFGLLKMKGLIEIKHQKGRGKFNIYTIKMPPPQVRERVLPQPYPLPKNYDDYMDICEAMGIDDRASDPFWELQKKNNWKRQNPSTGNMEPLFDWPKALIKFSEKVEDDIENINHN